MYQNCRLFWLANSQSYCPLTLLEFFPKQLNQGFDLVRQNRLDGWTPATPTPTGHLLKQTYSALEEYKTHFLHLIPTQFDIRCSATEHYIDLGRTPLNSSVVVAHWDEVCGIELTGDEVCHSLYCERHFHLKKVILNIKERAWFRN